MTSTVITPAQPGPVDELVSAVAALPLPAGDSGARWTLRTATVAWLRSRRSAHTRKAYFRELAGWLGWCDRTGLDPATAVRGDLDAYLSAEGGRTATGQPLSPASLARRISTLSAWYAYLASNGVVTGNPAGAVDRPELSPDASPTIGLSAAELARFVQAARRLRGRTAARDTALCAVLAELGLRVGEAIALDMGNLRHNRGHRTVRVHGKGGKFREVAVPAPLGRDLDAWLAERGQDDGPLFVTATGKRVDQPAVFRLVRRVATLAGIPAAEQLSPHSLRHTAATEALNAGASIRDVQDWLGHADPRTTRRYDRARGSLDRSPAYLLAGLFEDEG